MARSGGLSHREVLRKQGQTRQKHYNMLRQGKLGANRDNEWGLFLFANQATRCKQHLQYCHVSSTPVTLSFVRESCQDDRSAQRGSIFWILSFAFLNTLSQDLKLQAILRTLLIESAHGTE